MLLKALGPKDFGLCDLSIPRSRGAAIGVCGEGKVPCCHVGDPPLVVRLLLQEAARPPLPLQFVIPLAPVLRFYRRWFAVCVRVAGGGLGGRVSGG